MRNTGEYRLEEHSAREILIALRKDSPRNLIPSVVKANFIITRNSVGNSDDYQEVLNMVYLKMNLDLLKGKNNRDEKMMISAIFTKNNKLFKGNEDDYHKILASILSVSYEPVGRLH